jgi:hypothetical protein
MNIMSILGVYRPMFGLVTKPGLRSRCQTEFDSAAYHAKRDLGVYRR